MLTLKVKAMAGDDVRDIIPEMCLVASRTGCSIESDLNGVTVVAVPGTDPRELYAGWEVELRSNRTYKTVYGESVTIIRV